MLRARAIFSNLVISRRLTTVSKQKDVEYNETAEYPPILDNSYIKKKERKVQLWHEKIKTIGTIEEKLIEINLPRYYGFKCVMLNDREFPYNTLPFFQYATNTEFVEETKSPTDEEEAKKIDNFLNLIKSEIQDAFEFELDGYT